jgi:hypothetical protein
VSSGGSLAFQHIPKVLIPNIVRRAGIEDWIMPTGAGRILPVAQPFPAAFFYYQGSADYSYNEYLKHVCWTLDIDWLKARNIRFLFVPADLGGACVARLPELLTNGNVIARSGKAALIELF